MARKIPPRVSIGRAQEAPAPSPALLGETRLAGAREVPVDQVVPDPKQPRQDWRHDDGEQRLDELAASISEFGLLQPLLVREDGVLDDGRTRYVIISGGRRRAAAERAGRDTISIVVRGDESERVRVLQLVENLQRQDLAPLDEARAYQELLAIDHLSPQALADRLHISGQKVRDRLRLLADQVFADAVERRQISATAARDIMTLPDDEIARFRDRVLAGEPLQSNDIAVARARLAAAGIANPRRKGGGKVARWRDEIPTVATGSHDETPEGETGTPDHTTFDNVAVGHGDQATGEAALQRSDPVTPSASDVLTQGVIPMGTDAPAAVSTTSHLSVVPRREELEARTSNPRVQRHYAAFLDWRVSVYNDLERLSSDDIEELARLLRGDIEQLLERLDVAARRVKS
jgi:ParB/RepB/Spo0J family partition protein